MTSSNLEKVRENGRLFAGTSRKPDWSLRTARARHLDEELDEIRAQSRRVAELRAEREQLIADREARLEQFS